MLALALLAMSLATKPTLPPCQTAHLVDEHGNTLERFEPGWRHLETFYGAALPARMIVRVKEAGASLFSPADDGVTIDLRSWREGPLPVIVHEGSHIALGHLSGGASREEAFRFLDEGWAEVMEHRFLGDLGDYKELAVAVARREVEAGVDFARLRGWYTYFGRPPNVRPRGYAVGASLDLYLLEAHGEEKLRAFFAALGARDLDAAARKAFGRGASELEADWRAWLLAQAPLKEPKVVRLSPGQGARKVSRDTSEIEVELNVAMDPWVKLCVRTPCGDKGVCHTAARWKSPKVLAIRVEGRLPPNERYALGLGVPGCPLQSAAGVALPPTEWTFETEGAPDNPSR